MRTLVELASTVRDRRRDATADESDPTDTGDTDRDPGTVAADDRWYWEGVQDGRLCLQSCNHCDTCQHPPRSTCPACGATDFERVEAAGPGTVRSRPDPPQSVPVPESVNAVPVLVDLREGVTVLGYVVGRGHENLEAGTAVRLSTDPPTGTVPGPLFRPK